MEIIYKNYVNFWQKSIKLWINLNKVPWYSLNFNHWLHSQCFKSYCNGLFRNKMNALCQQHTLHIHTHNRTNTYGNIHIRTLVLVHLCKSWKSSKLGGICLFVVGFFAHSLPLSTFLVGYLHIITASPFNAEQKWFMENGKYIIFSSKSSPPPYLIILQNSNHRLRVMHKCRTSEHRTGWCGVGCELWQYLIIKCLLLYLIVAKAFIALNAPLRQPIRDENRIFSCLCEKKGKKVEQIERVE